MEYFRPVDTGSLAKMNMDFVPGFGFSSKSSKIIVDNKRLNPVLRTEKLNV